MTSSSPDPADIDPALDAELDAAADVGPEYGGTADAGIRSSVPEGDPMAGDAPALLRAELGKLYDLFGEVVALVDRDAFGELGQRWYGVVREALEFEAAVGRVVTPEVGDAAAGLGDDAPQAVIERLQAFDELNAELDPDAVRLTSVRVVEALQAQERALVPAVEALTGDARERLGEDLRQVMG